MSGFVTLLLVFCYPETKFSRKNILDIHVDVPEKEVKESSIHEKPLSSQRTSDDVEVLDGVDVRKGRPSKAQFSPVTKPEKNWMGFIIRDLTTPVVAFFNP